MEESLSYYTIYYCFGQFTIEYNSLDSSYISTLIPLAYEENNTILRQCQSFNKTNC